MHPSEVLFIQFSNKIYIIKLWAAITTYRSVRTFDLGNWEGVLYIVYCNSERVP